MVEPLVLFNMEFSWHAIFQKIGLLVAFIFASWHYRKRACFSLSFWQIIGLFLILFFLMLGGGRMIGFLEYYLRREFFPPLQFLFQGVESGGFRWCGSLLLALIGLPILSIKVLKIKYFNALLDMLVLIFCVFRMITVWACQLSGDGCYGVPTTMPWGMHYEYGNVPSILPVHPTPIYDSIINLLFFLWLLNWDLRKKKTAGQTAKIYFLIIPIFYIFLEIIRTNPVVAGGITLPQVVYGLIILLSIPIFKKLLKQEKRKVILSAPNANHPNNNKISKAFKQQHGL